MKHRKTTLGNGLRIITVPMTGTQTATLVMMVGVGSRFETDKLAGISHFIEHMLFKGTDKYPTSLAISETLDAVGGEFNAFTSKDKTAYYAKVDAKHLDIAMDVLTDMYKHSKFDVEEIEREKGAIEQEINMIEDRPSRKVWDVFDMLMFQGNPLGREILGKRQTVSSFSRSDLLRYMKRAYTGANTVICVAGRFNEDKVIARLRRDFEDLEQGKTIDFTKVKMKQNLPATEILYKKTDQTQLVIGSRAYDHDHPDRYALLLLSVILGGNMSSRLFVEIREKRGLAYSIGTSVDSYPDCGYLATKLGVAHDKLSEAVTTILDEYAKIASEGVSAKEVANAKQYLKGKVVMDMEASDEVALFYVDQETSKGRITPPKELFSKINAVSAEDVKRVAGDILRKETLDFAIVGPHRGDGIVKKALKASTF